MKKLVGRISLLLAVSLMITVFAGAAVKTKEYELSNGKVTISLPADWKVDTTQDQTGILLRRVEAEAGQVQLTVEKRTVYELTDVQQTSSVQSAAVGKQSSDSTVLTGVGIQASESTVLNGVDFQTYFESIEQDGKTLDRRSYWTDNAGTEYRFIFEKTGLFSEADVTEIETIMASVKVQWEIRQPQTVTRDFLDVKGHWAEESITKVKELGLFSGTGENTFSPNVGMTRAMLVQVLHRMAGEPEAGSARFTDVAEDAWYAKAVAWAAENGIVEGADGLFRPNDLVTRQELAAILYRYDAGEAETAEDALDAFADAENIASWAKTSMAWAVEQGLLQGSNGSLLPAKTATRAEVATILVRYLDVE